MSQIFGVGLCRCCPSAVSDRTRPSLLWSCCTSDSTASLCSVSTGYQASVTIYSFHSRYQTTVTCQPIGANLLPICSQFAANIQPICSEYAVILQSICSEYATNVRPIDLQRIYRQFAASLQLDSCLYTLLLSVVDLYVNVVTDPKRTT